MKAELLPEGAGAPIPILRDVTVVGRREFCDVQLDHPSLSKRHCVLVKTDGLLVVRDLVSTNGTKVKGQKIRWAALLPDDRLTLGALKFRVYLGPDDVPSPSERVAKAASARGVAGPGFAEPSPVQGIPVVPPPRAAAFVEPLTKVVGNEEDLVLVDEDDEEIIELE